MTKRDPLVSIIIPVWNTEERVKRLIEGLFEQSYRNIEIIAVDDGSSDNSLRALKELEKCDVRLKVKHQENAGASAARNTGIEIARGEFVIFSDSDDEVRRDFVEKMVERFERGEEVSLVATAVHYNKLQKGSSSDVYTEVRRGRRTGERKADYVIELLIRDGRMYGVINKAFRMKVIKDFGLRFEEGRDFAEDTKFVLDYLEHAPGEIGFVYEPLYRYNFGTETSTVRASSVRWENWEKSYDDLRSWAKNVSGGRIGAKTRALLWLVRMRWRVSHYRARKRARARR